MGEIQRTAQQTADSPVGEAFIRWGHAIRGIIYLAFGVLAVQWAIGYRNNAPGPKEVINLASQSPFGKILLVLIILGLIGYAGWGLIRLTWKRPISNRLGYLTSALGYGLLIYPAVNLLRNQPSPSNHQLTSLTQTPAGKVVLVVVGIGMLIGGIVQIKEGFDKDWLERAGLWGRGLLIMFLGGFLITEKITDIAQVLVIIGTWKFGSEILIFIGVGLVALGLQSLLLAKRNEHTG